MNRTAVLTILLGVACARLSAADETVLIGLAQEGGAYRLEGTFYVGSPVETVWRVLTDYEGIERFVPSMRESRVKEHRGRFALVEQEAVGKILLFSKRMKLLLDVRETPMQVIEFRDLEQSDFALFEGSWRIVREPLGTRVIYALKVQPSFYLPGFITRTACRRTVEQLLRGVQTEILKQAAGPQSALGRNANERFQNLARPPLHPLLTKEGKEGWL